MEHLLFLKIKWVMIIEHVITWLFHGIRHDSSPLFSPDFILLGHSNETIHLLTTHNLCTVIHYFLQIS